MKSHACILMMLLIPFSMGANATSKPTTQPATQAAKEKPPRDWKWSNSDLSSEKQVTDLKETLIGMTDDEMFAALKAANFTPPKIKSADTGGVTYETGCIIAYKNGKNFYNHQFRIVVSDQKKVVSFKSSSEDL